LTHLVGFTIEIQHNVLQLNTTQRSTTKLILNIHTYRAS